MCCYPYHLIPPLWVKCIYLILSQVIALLFFLPPSLTFQREKRVQKTLKKNKSSFPMSRLWKEQELLIRVKHSPPTDSMHHKSKGASQHKNDLFSINRHPGAIVKKQVMSGDCMTKEESWSSYEKTLPSEVIVIWWWSGTNPFKKISRIVQIHEGKTVTDISYSVIKIK